ncbi:MAG: glycerate kinase [Hyphomicrobiaceae bacterium]
MDHKAFLRNLFDAAVKAADPIHCLPNYLPAPPKRRTIVVGAGKAAASMAKATEQNWAGDISGLVVTRYEHGLDCARIEVVEAAHPVPDAKGLEAANRILAAVQELTADDLVLCLISGGGSALLTLPGPGIPLEDKQELNRALLKSGANITDMNTVRKHLSAIKGGRLALAAAPAQVVTLAISDVPGDDPAVIASGPTVGDATTVADAQAVLDRYGITPPHTISTFLNDRAAETPKPDDPSLAHCTFRMVATPMASLEAAAKLCHEAGITPEILGDDLEGEAREVAADHAAQATAIAASLAIDDAPVALISGGETTVTVRGSGRGGRNAEYLLALAVALDGNPQVHAIACDTDGIDGSEDNAGAITGPTTLSRAQAATINASACLSNNDGYTFFQKLDDLVMTGPTLTNINDFRAILITPPAA